MIIIMVLVKNTCMSYMAHTIHTCTCTCMYIHTPTQTLPATLYITICTCIQM